MNGQMSIFDFLSMPKVIPGELITRKSGIIGDEMAFDEIAESVGDLIAVKASSENHELYRVVLVERIIMNEGQRRLVYYDGHKQRGLVNEMYFSEKYPFRSRAYKLMLT